MYPKDAAARFSKSKAENRNGYAAAAFGFFINHSDIVAIKASISA